MVPASKDKMHSVAQQGKSNADAFIYIDCSPGIHNLSVLLSPLPVLLAPPSRRQMPEKQIQSRQCLRNGSL